MNAEERAAAKEANRIKNERRRKTKKSRTLYAREGRAVRRQLGGAFGAEDPGLYNQAAEGTTAVRRAENKL